MDRPVTAFERRVYEVTTRIPKGKVATYKDLARAVGCGSSRAIGQALKRNPFAPRVPCHRIIRSDLTIGGFGGQATGTNVRRKEALLRKEGVTFKDARLVEASRLYHF